MCNEAARRATLGLISNDFSQTRIPLRFPEGLPNLASLDSIRITDPTVIVRAAADASAEMVQRRWSWGAAGGGAGKPVYNFRSEGREFRNSASGGRCLIPLDGFYEFTDPGTLADAAAAADVPATGARAAGAGEAASGGVAATGVVQPDLLDALPRTPALPRTVAAPRKAARPRKDKWLFTLADPPEGLFCVAGLWRADPAWSAAGYTEAFTMLTCAPGPDIAPYHSRQIVLMPREHWAAWLDDANPAAGLIAPTPAGTLQVARAR